MPAKVLIFDGISSCFGKNITLSILLLIYVLSLQVTLIVNIVVVAMTANLMFTVSILGTT